MSTIVDLSPTPSSPAAEPSLAARAADVHAMGLGLLAIAAFALTLPMSRIAVRSLDPWFVGLGRGAVAGVLALGYLVAIRARLPSRVQLRGLAAAALGVVFGFPMLASWAMSRVPASHGGVVLALVPLATAIAATRIAGERPSPRFWLAGVVGSGLVVAFALRRSGLVLEPGDLALLGAVVMAAIGYAWSGRLSRELGGATVISWMLVLSLPITLPAAWILRPTDVGSIGIGPALAFGYLAVVSQYVGFFPWNRALALGGIARVGQLQLVQPFLTVLASTVLLGEPLTFATLGFAAAVVLTVAFGRSADRR